jgi:hypothetical protein
MDSSLDQAAASGLRREPPARWKRPAYAGDGGDCLANVELASVEIANVEFRAGAERQRDHAQNGLRFKMAKYAEAAAPIVGSRRSLAEPESWARPLNGLHTCKMA